MTQTEIAEFRLMISQLDASFDELTMLISFMVKEAALEYAHAQHLEDLK